MNLSQLATYCEASAVDAMGEMTNDVDTLARLLADARRAAKAMSDTARRIEGALAEAMPTRQVVVEGLGTLEKKWNPARTTWEHDRLALVVAAASRDERHLDTVTGVIEGEAEAAARVMLETCGISYWRTGALKQRGIEPDDYREKEGGRWAVVVT